MENINENSCLLCLSSSKHCKELDETTKQVLDIVFVNKTLQFSKRNAICATCFGEVHKAFCFKCKCIETEDFLVPFEASATTSQLDLKDIYTSRNRTASFVDNSKNQKVCRLCFLSISGSYASLLDDAQQDVLLKYIPELILENTKDPVACQACLKSLRKHSVFINDCLHRLQDRDDAGFISDSYSEVEVKYEPCGGCENLNFDVKSGNNGQGPTSTGAPCVNVKNNVDGLEAAFNFPTPQDIYTSADERIIKAPESENFALNQTPMSHRNYALDDYSIPTNLTNVKKHENQEIEQGETYSFLLDLDLHMLNSREPMQPKEEFKSKERKCKIVRQESTSTTRMYRCDYCDFQTRYAGSLRTHTLRHKTNSKAPKYKCLSCSYRTGYKGFLKQHAFMHECKSGAKTFDCMQCDYTTQHRSALKSHVLSHHVDPSELPVYRCKDCDYRTRYRNALKSHELKHKALGEIEMRKCNLCSYETRHRTALVLHHLKHKKPSEIQMYKCDKCKFQTKFKHALKPHVLSKHKTK